MSKYLFNIMLIINLDMSVLPISKCVIANKWHKTDMRRNTYYILLRTQLN